MEPPRRIVVEFSREVYELTVIKKAAYKFAARCGIHIEPDGSRAIMVYLDPNDGEDANRLRADLQAEVLDQDLRRIVAAETEGVRNLILAQAFSPVSLVSAESSTAAFGEDPLGIAVPDKQRDGQHD